MTCSVCADAQVSDFRGTPSLGAGRGSPVVATNLILLFSSQIHRPPPTRTDRAVPPAAAAAPQLEVSECLAWAPQGDVWWVLGQMPQLLPRSVGEPCSETRVHVQVMIGAGLTRECLQSTLRTLRFPICTFSVTPES